MQALKEKLKKPPIQLAVLFGTLILFLITNATLRDSPFGFLPLLLSILIVIEIFIFVGMEVKDGAEKHGWKHEVVDTVIALLVAVMIWFGLSFVLNTGSPVSGVVSCSMLPNLQRGDFVVVQGAVPKAYELNMTGDELDSLSSRSFVSYPGGNLSTDGSIFAYCLRNRNTDACKAFISNPESVREEKGAFTYRYERCNITYSSGSSATEPCLKSVIFKGKEYLTDFSNDIVVYQPLPGDLFSLVGDIVHRVLFRINAGGKTYYLTRGDNNPVLDLQVYDYAGGVGNHPVPAERLRGKVIARIPYLGYFKLFISGYLNEDPQCKTQLYFTHANPAS
ncbi:MAG: hypothetical protein U0R44_03335 [Candidatus Micrarchaeia archaeon]